MRFFVSKSERRGSNSRHSAWKADALPTELLSHLRFLNLRLIFLRAKDEGRTRDIQLGRLTLYQLSYFRIYDF